MVEKMLVRSRKEAKEVFRRLRRRSSNSMQENGKKTVARFTVRRYIAAPPLNGSSDPAAENRGKGPKVDP